MAIQMVQARPSGRCEIGADQLRGDYRLLCGLLERFELADDCYVRRDLMELVVDLFEVHVAIRALVKQPSHEALREREAVYELMEQVEGTDARSRLHLARGIELGRALQAYVAGEDMLAPGQATLRLPRGPESRSLLNDHASLVDGAQQLLRLH
jgi:hypothetical protein